MKNSSEILKELKTERLLLKPISREYTEDLFKHLSDPEVTKYMDIDTMESIKEAEEIIDYYIEKEDERTCYRWVILDKQNKEFIGTCGFNSWNRNRANRSEIGYDLSKKYWGQGYMVEALKVLLKHGFEILDVHRIQAKVTEGNIPSCKLLEKMNFTKEGLLRDYNYWKDGFINEYMYSLLEDEYRSNF